MVVVVVLALGGAAGGIKYLHDLAAHNQHRRGRPTQGQQAPSDPAGQAAPAPPSDFLSD